jgi:Tfp pilus assembly protein PilO
MANAFNRFLAISHLLFILWVGWGIYEQYEVHIQDYEALKNQVPLIERKIKKKQRELTGIEKYYADIEAAKKRIKLVAEAVEKLQKQLPTKKMDSANVSLFQQESNDINIKKLAITPGAERNKGFYFEKDFSYKGVGTFLQFLILFERIATNDQLFNIRSMTITKSQEKQKGRFQLVNLETTIQSFRYNENYVEQTGIDEIERRYGKGKKDELTGDTRKRPKKKKRRSRKR